MVQRQAQPPPAVIMPRGTTAMLNPVTDTLSSRRWLGFPVSSALFEIRTCRGTIKGLPRLIRREGNPAHSPGLLTKTGRLSSFPLSSTFHTESVAEGAHREQSSVCQQSDFVCSTLVAVGGRGRSFHVSRFPLWHGPERRGQAFGSGCIGSDNHPATSGPAARVELASGAVFHRCRRYRSRMV